MDAGNASIPNASVNRIKKIHPSGVVCGKLAIDERRAASVCLPRNVLCFDIKREEMACFALFNQLSVNLRDHRNPSGDVRAVRTSEPKRFRLLRPN
ncbi:unnamed protein product [Euphydryas editha]|uniref:Uncharacterized protein n=1 Tax=Euphydryas editha TaxID=104508 RepID=A0AAU9V1J9_EUPED|nr:unnamed protein product [Euphydryas editha]